MEVTQYITGADTKTPRETAMETKRQLRDLARGLNSETRISLYEQNGEQLVLTRKLLIFAKCGRFRSTRKCRASRRSIWRRWRKSCWNPLKHSETFA